MRTRLAPAQNRLAIPQPKKYKTRRRSDMDGERQGIHAQDDTHRQSRQHPWLLPLHPREAYWSTPGLFICLNSTA